MPTDNLQRMIQLADEVFAVKNDPEQLNVNQKVLKHLYKIHPSTLSEYDDGNGPVAWILIIPTTTDLMNRFLEGKISEKKLYELTPIGAEYEAIYLCSALVLEEYRRKGIAKQLALKAIESMRKDHQLKAMFVWPFTEEGDLASEAFAKLTKLPLFKRTK
jgi:ribosomal protein S18 acetylase RimI-like enzyme